MYHGVNVTLSRVVGSPFTQETSNLPSWAFFSWVTSFTIRAFILVFFMVVSYFSTKLARTRFVHITSIGFNFWDTNRDFDKVNLNSFQVVTPCHPLMVWYILHQVAAPLSKQWRASWAISFSAIVLFSICSESIGPCPIESSVQKI